MTPADENLHMELSENALRLRRRWWAAAGLGLVFQLAGAAVIAHFWQGTFAWQWMLAPAGVFVYILIILKNGLRLNYRPEENRLLPGLGIGNWITFLRANLVAALAGWFFLPWPALSEASPWPVWVPGTLYLSTSILDYFDGFAARATGHQTRLGERLDTKVDALGLLVATLVAIKMGQLPLFYISVAAAYYLLQFGIWARVKYAKPIVELKPYPQARLMAGLQMGFVSVSLYPILKPPITTVAAFVFMMPFLLGFLRDWLVISGRTATGRCQMAGREMTLYRWIAGWIPLFFRLCIIIIGITVVSKMISAAAFYIDAGTPQRLYLTDSLSRIFLIGLLILIGLGVLGRLSAVLLGLSTGHLILNGMYGLDFYGLFIAACCLIITGSGALSLWTPEERILMGNRYHDFPGNLIQWTSPTNCATGRHPHPDPVPLIQSKRQRLS